MKYLITALMALSSLALMAHEIEGVQMLKGTLKTEVRVNGIKTTCKVQIEDVKNLMEEDKFGNPAYKVKVEVSLSGGEFLSSRKVKLDKKLTMNNLFEDGVRDLEYRGDGVKLTIQKDGRLSEAHINYHYGPVICNF
ncbi:MAG TPA: hypothetical protein VNJ08_02400 [Bacteriovoracaceae bacterium]|nr:hypothetical protein [Bacteriovoracaceae bacterium]